MELPVPFYGRLIWDIIFMENLFGSYCKIGIKLIKILGEDEGVGVYREVVYDEGRSV